MMMGTAGLEPATSDLSRVKRLARSAARRPFAGSLAIAPANRWVVVRRGLLGFIAVLVHRFGLWTRSGALRHGRAALLGLTLRGSDREGLRDRQRWPRRRYKCDRLRAARRWRLFLRAGTCRRLRRLVVPSWRCLNMSSGDRPPRHLVAHGEVVRVGRRREPAVVCAAATWQARGEASSASASVGGRARGSC